MTDAIPCLRLCACRVRRLDHLDDAFWRLGERGNAYFLDALEWGFAYREMMLQWVQSISVSKTVQKTLTNVSLNGGHSTL